MMLTKLMNAWLCFMVRSIVRMFFLYYHRFIVNQTLIAQNKELLGPMQVIAPARGVTNMQ